MKCPYCAEDIRDEAVVCRYCRRDLAFFKPMAERISSLESRISEITASLNALQSKDQPIIGTSHKERTSCFPFWRFGLVGLLALMVSIGSYGILAANARNYPLPFYVSVTGFLLLSLSILSPFPSGFWLGLTLRGGHLKAYALLGLSVGVISGIGVELLAERVMNPSLGNTPGRIELPRTWDDPIFLYPLGGILLFTSGGLLGEQVRRKRFPREAEPGFAERIATKILGTSREKHEGSDEQVKRLASIIKALAPILPLIGSIITAYFQYLAAPIKK